MKKILTMFCALLCFGAMASASVGDDGYLDISTTSNDGLCTYDYKDGVATITINPAQWTVTGDKDKAEAYVGSGATVDVTKSEPSEAGLTAYDADSYTETEGDVFYYWDNGLWKCIGWWIGDFDASAYEKVVVTLASTSAVTVCVQDDLYDGNTSANSTGTGQDETVVVNLSTLTNPNKVTQVYIQNNVAEQVITVKSVQFVAAEPEPEPEVNSYTYNFADATDGIDISSLKLDVDGKNATLVATDNTGNDAIAYFTTSSVSTTEDEGDGVLELYGAKYDKSNGPYAGTVNDEDETPILWTSGKTQKSSSVWYDYFKVNVPEEYVDQYITISVDYISGKNGEDRYLVVDQTLSDISSEEVDAINAHLASSVSSGQAKDYKATTTYYGTTALEGTEEFYLIASNNVGVYSITVTFSSEAPTGTSTTVAVAEPVEIEGYLTVSVGSTVGDPQKVSVTVTEDADETTISVDELTIMTGVTITDISISFTTGDNGAYEDGILKGTLGNDELEMEATGIYTVSDDGEVTFTASFTYGTSPFEFTINIEFTTVKPVAEPEYGWTLITDEFDDGDLYVANSGNYITLAWADLANYTQIAIVAYTSEDYDDWGNIQVDQKWNAVGDNWTTNKDAEYQYIVYDLAGLQAEVDAKAETTTEVFYVTFWNNTTSAAIYGYGEISEDAGTEEPSEESGAEEVTVVVYESEGETGVSVMLSDDSVFWTLFQAEDTQSLTLTVVMDNSNCTSEIGYGNLRFGGNYDGTILETKEEKTAWLSSGTVCVAETAVETIVLTVDDISDLFNAKATASWDLGAEFDGTCAWGSVDSYADGPATYIDDEFEIENLHGLQLSVFNSSKLVSVSYTYLGQKPTTSTDEGGSTAISNVNVEVTEVARYNLMGQKISGAEKGINIIVYSDGSAKKVLVK